MTPRAILPEEGHVRKMMAEVIATARENRRKPTVVALARELGMSNSSFWRHFPDIAQELADLARTAGAERPRGEDPGRRRRLEEENARLRRDKAELRRDLDAATAVIQRLALQNDRQRRELEAVGKVTRMRPRILAHHEKDNRR